MTLEKLDSSLLVESAEWTMYRAIKWLHANEDESLVRINNLLDRRLALSRFGPVAANAPVFSNV